MSVRAFVKEWMREADASAYDLSPGERSQRILDAYDGETSLSTVTRYERRFRELLDGGSIEECDSIEGCSGEGEPGAPPDEPIGLEVLERDYDYFEDRDTYRAWIPCLSRWIEVDGETTREMKRAYSSEVGKGAHIEDVATRYGWREKVFEQFKNALGWTHGQDRYTDEEHVARDTSALVKDTASAERGRYIRERRRAEHEAVREKAQKWDDFTYHVAEPMIEGLKDAPMREDIPRVSRNPEPIVAVFNPADGHLDQQNLDGSGFDRNKSVWLDAHGQLLDDTRRYCQPEYIDLALGNDQWNIDTDHMTTTNGTPQDNDLLPREGIYKVAGAGCEAIEMCRELARVRVRVVPGNHDRRTAQMYLWGLMQRYSDCEDVEIVGRGEGYQYDRYGSNLFGWHHGDGIGGGKTNKAEKLNTKMTGDARELWGKTRHSYWFLGHLEHLWEDTCGVHAMQAPTTKDTDRYHEHKAFTSSDRAQCAWAFRKEGGQCARFMALVS